MRITSPLLILAFLGMTKAHEHHHHHHHPLMVAQWVEIHVVLLGLIQLQITWTILMMLV